MTDKPHPGGAGSIGTYPVARVGYGAMKLTGDQVWGPYPDHDQAIRVLRAEGGTRVFAYLGQILPIQLQKVQHSGFRPVRDDGEYVEFRDER